MKLEWLEWERIERLVQRLPEQTRRLTLWERSEGRERMIAQQHIDDASLRACLEIHREPESEPVTSLLESNASSPTGSGRRSGRRGRAGGGGEDRIARGSVARSSGRSTPEAVQAQIEAAQCPGETASVWRALAITQWVRTCALRCVREDAELIRFRLRAHGEEGRPIASACFSICNLTWIPAEDDLPADRHSSSAMDTVVGQPAAMSANPQQYAVGYVLPPELAPVEAYQALGRYYAQTGQIWLEGYQTILAVHTTLLHDTLERLLRSRDLEDTLRAEIVRLHLEHLQQMLATKREAGDAAMRDALVLQALAALQDVSRAAQASRIEAARLTEVRALIDAAPGIVALLQDPAIQSLLRDPRHVPMLAEVLRSVAAQLAGQRSAP